MKKIFIVLSYFSEQNCHFTNTSVCFATCSKSSAKKIISIYEKYNPGTSFEIVETELFK